MKVFLRTLALILCAVLVFSSVVSAAGIIAADESDGAAAVYSNETVDEPGEPGETEQPGEPGNPGETDEPGEPEETEKPEPQLVISDSQISVTVNSRFPINAELKNSENQSVKIAWSSANPSVATVNGNGVVSGKAAGKTKITATATDGGKTYSASCTVSVTSRRMIPHFLLSISYRYSNLGDYYYSDNDYAWQKPFGFIRLYDNASQIIGYQYDFVRLPFTYGNKDWLIELWKGQYGLFQMGGEIGVYTKYSVGFGDTLASVYNCAGKSDWLNMEMTLYHTLSNGTVRREFTRDYGKYWWCDGYKVGSLTKSKPARELQMVSRITLKDEKMAQAFAKSMKSCGFSQVDSLEQIKDDSFCLDGSDVYFIWRNLTESQSLVPININGETVSPISIFFAAIRLLGEAFISSFRFVTDIGNTAA
ncbi:MAG: DUF4474 domain-containing protein [Clostridia bacterium]|nr:DUF4474 domain-containing protein [Clostridia bacterium]